MTGKNPTWIRAQQQPGVVFPFPKGSKLIPEEDVVLALPVELIEQNETIGSILLCDDNADLALNDEAGIWLVKLKSGMTFELAKSCEIMIVAQDERPRFFQYLKLGH